MASDIRVGDILEEQEHPTEDIFQAEELAAAEEDQLGHYEAVDESDEVFEVKRLSQMDTGDDSISHPIMVQISIN